MWMGVSVCDHILNASDCLIVCKCRWQLQLVATSRKQCCPDEDQHLMRGVPWKICENFELALRDRNHEVDLRWSKHGKTCQNMSFIAPVFDHLSQMPRLVVDSSSFIQVDLRKDCTDFPVFHERRAYEARPKWRQGWPDLGLYMS